MLFVLYILWKVDERVFFFSEKFIPSFIFRKSFTRYGNGHFYNNTRKKEK